MALANSLIKAARKLIDTFGNDSSLYLFSGVTSSTNEEGDITVTNWGTPTTIKMVDGGNQGSTLTQGMQGRERLGADEKIIRDDVTISLNDRINYRSKDYRVVEIQEENVESTVVIQVIRVSEVTDTSQW